MALHVVVTDFGLTEDHANRYGRVGRWVLAGAVGVAVGTRVDITEAALGVLIAFLAGGVILNVLKEEAPAERQSRSLAFVAGMAGYAVLLLTF